MFPSQTLCQNSEMVFKITKGLLLLCRGFISPEIDMQESDEDPVNTRCPLDCICSDEYVAAPCKISFLEKALAVTPQIVKDISSATVGQSTNPLWITVRDYRLTASNFGAILGLSNKKVNKGVPSLSLLKRLYKPPNLDKIKATLWGRKHEKVARKKFCSDNNLEVVETGIWLHECGFLGASPDGLVGEDAIIEIKCSFAYRNDDLCDVLAKTKTYIVYLKNEEWHLNFNHQYYHQVQGQLHIIKKSVCYLVIWTTKSMLMFQIPRACYWCANFKPLQNFYCDHFVPFVRSQRGCNNGL